MDKNHSICLLPPNLNQESNELDGEELKKQSAKNIILFPKQKIFIAKGEGMWSNYMPSFFWYVVDKTIPSLINISKREFIYFIEHRHYQRIL